MKNKLQQKICTIFQRTINAILHIFSKLCVSLKRTDNTTEKDLCEKEKCGKFEKIVFLNHMKNLGKNNRYFKFGYALTEPIVIFSFIIGGGVLWWSMCTPDLVLKPFLAFISAFLISIGANFFSSVYQKEQEKIILRQKAETTVRQSNTMIKSILRKDKLDNIDLIIIDNLVNNIDYWKDYYPEANTNKLQELIALRILIDKENDENEKRRIQQNISLFEQNIMMGPTGSFVSLSANTYYQQYTIGGK